MKTAAPKLLLTEQNAEQYLRGRGFVSADERVDVRFLAGGVSNIVLYVRIDGGANRDFVLKQACPQLRVPQPWFCSVERIWREVAVLRLCERILASGDDANQSRVIHLPKLLFEDRENYAFGMTAAPLGHTTWKQQLLDGIVEQEIARSCGRLLGQLHAQTWRDPRVADELEDRQYFDDLRVDPYYRQIARVHADLAPAVERLIESVWSHRRSLVHGDFSPKNLLVWPTGLMLIDCEVGHYGDPAFDLGFFLTHLVLKSRTFQDRFGEYFSLCEHFWADYEAVLAPRIGQTEWQSLEARTQWNLAGCMLARIDGKSRVEYLRDIPPLRALARDMLLDPAATWRESATRIAPRDVA